MPSSRPGSPCLVLTRADPLVSSFGFPTFEEVIFTSIAASYDELQSIFTYDAKSGTAGATSADQAMTIQQTELGNLALDIGILSESFNMTHIQWKQNPRGRLMQ